MQPKKEAKRHGIHDDMHIREMFFGFFVSFSRNFYFFILKLNLDVNALQKLKITIYASLTDDIFTPKTHDMFIRRRNFKAKNTLRTF